MTKIEYLKQLEDELRYKISEQEMYDIMRDYAEYFEEGKKQGKTDKQIIEALGIPYVVAKQILGENPDDINVAIKKGTSNLKSSFNSFKEGAKNKYTEQKEKYSEKKEQKEQVKRNQPPKVKEKKDSNFLVNFCSIILKLALWIFLFIPLIIGVGASGAGLIIGSIVGIGFLSAFSFTVSTYTIFTASLILLCLLFGGLTIIFGLIWFIKYLLGVSDLKEQYAFNGAPNMNYNNYNFNQQQNPNNFYTTANDFNSNPQETTTDFNENEVSVEAADEKPSEIPAQEDAADEKPIDEGETEEGK